MISSHDPRFAHGGRKKFIVSESKSSDKENATPSGGREPLRPLLSQSSLPDPWQPWQASHNQALTKRVEDLEKKLGSMEQEHRETREQISRLHASQQDGFGSLMAAIESLKLQSGAVSSASTPVQSPPAKIPKHS